MTSVDTLKKGESARIETLMGSPGFISRAAAMGITPGVRVTTVQNRKSLPLLIFLRDTLVALDRRDARRVIIHDIHSQV